MSEYVAVAKVSDIPVGGMRFVGVDGVPIALCRVDGAVYAVGNVCTHDAGTLSGGTLDGYEIECPRHGARFDVRTGRALCLPAPTPIPHYDVKIEGDVITVKV